MISFTSTCIVNAGDCGNLGLSDIPMDRSARGTHILWLVGSHVHGFKKKVEGECFQYLFGGSQTNVRYNWIITDYLWLINIEQDGAELNKTRSKPGQMRWAFAGISKWQLMILKIHRNLSGCYAFTILVVVFAIFHWFDCLLCGFVTLMPLWKLLSLTVYSRCFYPFGTKLTLTVDHFIEI